MPSIIHKCIPRFNANQVTCLGNTLTGLSINFKALLKSFLQLNYGNLQGIVTHTALDYDILPPVCSNLRHLEYEKHMKQ